MSKLLMVIAVINLLIMPALAAEEGVGYWMPELNYGEDGNYWGTPVEQATRCSADQLCEDLFKVVEGSKSLRESPDRDLAKLWASVSDVVLGKIGSVSFGVWASNINNPAEFKYVRIDGVHIDSAEEGPEIKIGFVGFGIKKLTEVSSPQYSRCQAGGAIMVPGEWMIERPQDPEVDTPPIIAGRRFQALEVLRSIAVICNQEYGGIEAEIKAFDLYQAMISATHPDYQKQINELGRSLAWRPGLEMSLQPSHEDYQAVDEAGELLPTPISAVGFTFNTLFGIGSAALAEHLTGDYLMSARADLLSFLEAKFRPVEQ